MHFIFYSAPRRGLSVDATRCGATPRGTGGRPRGRRAAWKRQRSATALEALTFLPLRGWWQAGSRHHDEGRHDVDPGWAGLGYWLTAWASILGGNDHGTVLGVAVAAAHPLAGPTWR